MTPKKLCTGCSACLNICPVNAVSMVSDNEGFLYPKINYNACIKCGKCNEVCPLSPISKEKNTSDVKASYMAYSEDKAIRMNSSSGGMFSVLAENIIENGGVVVGCSLSEDCREVSHIIVDNKADLFKLRGSKYIQSNVGLVFKRIKTELEDNRYVLFSGTPCQIAGLKFYLGKEYDNLLLVDVICHGAPSPLVWRKYLDFLEADAESKAEAVNFRNKISGWKKYSLSISFDNKSEYISSITDDLYLRGFIFDFYLRPSCYSCEFKSNHYYSDITLADFWGVKRIAPEKNDDTGISLVIVHTDKGNDMFTKIQNKCYFEEVEFEKAIKSNPSYFDSVKENSIRKKFFKDLNKKSIGKVLKKYCSDAFTAKIRRKLSNKIGG